MIYRVRFQYISAFSMFVWEEDYTSRELAENRINQEVYICRRLPADKQTACWIEEVEDD